MAQDSVSTIRRSTIGFFSGTMLSRLSGLLREVSLAYAFGTHEALAAFFIAFRFAHLARRLLGEGSLQSAFLPLFEEEKAVSFPHACRFFRDLSLLWTSLLILFCLTAICGLSFSLYFFPSQKEILFLCWLMIPSLIPICLFGLNTAFLQAQNHYFLTAAAPIYFNCVLIFSALFLKNTPPPLAMPLLSVGIVLACTAQYIASFIPVFKTCWQTLGTEFFSKISPLSQKTKKIFAPISLSLIGIGASQINTLIDTLFARAADIHGPAYLWFAIRFQQLPLGLFGIALSSAILPPLIRTLRDNDHKKFLSFLEFGLRQVYTLLAPCTALFFIAGAPLIASVYGHGNFDLSSVHITTQCLQGYAIGLIPMGATIVLTQPFYAQKQYAIPVRAALISLILNIVWNTCFVFLFGWKSVSIALATSLSAWINAFYLYSKLKKTYGSIITSSGIYQIIGTTFSIIGATILTLLFSQALPSTFMEQLVLISSQGLVFMASLFGIAKLFKAHDLFHFFPGKTKHR